MIAIIDYGVGNLFSLKCSLKYIGFDAEITSDVSKIKKSDRIILPGVGAFSDAIKKLRESGLDKVIIEQTEKGKPLLGICLGMQMLFEKSYEHGEHDGLALIKGQVVPISNVVSEDYKIPHIGWNALKFPENKEKSLLFKYVNKCEYVYFVHSFFATDCDDSRTAFSEYGANLTAAAEKKNVYGTQFHPEKSGEVGLNILKVFCEI